MAKIQEFRVLKTFPFAQDGNPPADVDEGDVISVPERFVPGLVAAGLITSATTMGEAASKVSGTESLLAAGDVNSGVRQDAAQAARGISDGLVGAPEAAAILDQHKTFMDETKLEDGATVPAGTLVADQDDPNAPSQTGAGATSEEKAAAQDAQAGKNEAAAEQTEADRKVAIDKAAAEKAKARK